MANYVSQGNVGTIEAQFKEHVRVLMTDGLGKDRIGELSAALVGVLDTPLPEKVSVGEKTGAPAEAGDTDEGIDLLAGRPELAALLDAPSFEAWAGEIQPPDTDDTPDGDGEGIDLLAGRPELAALLDAPSFEAWAGEITPAEDVTD